jgi:hypothetical protein
MRGINVMCLRVAHREGKVVLVPGTSGWTTEPRLNYGDDFLIFLDAVEWASGI